MSNASNNCAGKMSNTRTLNVVDDNKMSKSSVYMDIRH